DALAPADVEIDIAENVKIAVPFVEAGNADNGICGHGGFTQVRRWTVSRFSTKSEKRDMPKQKAKEIKTVKGKPVKSVVGVAQVGSLKEARSCPSRSNSATIETSEVSLNSAMKLLTRPGMTWRKACGITISAVVFHQDRPSALAASAWPRGIAC